MCSLQAKALVRKDHIHFEFHSLPLMVVYFTYDFHIWTALHSLIFHFFWFYFEKRLKCSQIFALKNANILSFVEEKSFKAVLCRLYYDTCFVICALCVHSSELDLDLDLDSDSESNSDSDSDSNSGESIINPMKNSMLRNTHICTI